MLSQWLVGLEWDKTDFIFFPCRLFKSVIGGGSTLSQVTGWSSEIVGGKNSIIKFLNLNIVWLIDKIIRSSVQLSGNWNLHQWCFRGSSLRAGVLKQSLWQILHILHIFVPFLIQKQRPRDCSVDYNKLKLLMYNYDTESTDKSRYLSSHWEWAF